VVEYLRVFGRVGFFLVSIGAHEGKPTSACFLVEAGRDLLSNSGLAAKGCFMGLLLLIVLILLLVGGLPTWGHSRNWGYGPSGGIGFLLVVLVVVILFTDVIHFSRF
jgi:hypothetical protein